MIPSVDSRSHIRTFASFFMRLFLIDRAVYQSVLKNMEALSKNDEDQGSDSQSEADL